MVSGSLVGWAVWAVLGLDDVLAVASDETVTTQFALITVIFSAIVPCGQAAFMGGASVVVFQTGVMARWIAWWGRWSRWEGLRGRCGASPAILRVSWDLLLRCSFDSWSGPSRLRSR